MDFVRIAQRHYGSTALPVESSDFCKLFDGLALYGCEQVRSKVSSLKHARMLAGPHDRPVMEFAGQ